MQLLHLVGIISLLSMMHGTTNIKLNLCLSNVFNYVHNMTICYDRVLMRNRHEILSNYVHNMTICYDRVLMRNRHEILSKLHSPVSKNQQDAYWQGTTNRIQIKVKCPQHSTKQRPKSQTFHYRGIPSQWAMCNQAFINILSVMAVHLRVVCPAFFWRTFVT